MKYCIILLFLSSYAYAGGDIAKVESSQQEIVTPETPTNIQVTDETTTPQDSKNKELIQQEQQQAETGDPTTEGLGDKMADMGRSIGTDGDAGYGGSSTTLPLGLSGGKDYKKCRKLLKELDDSVEITEIGALLSQSEKLKAIRNVKKSSINAIKRDMDMVAHCIVLATTMQNAEVLDSPGEFGKQQKSQSMDQRITCESAGITTIDYPACQNAITAYNAFILGQKALDGYHQIDLQATNMDAQSKVNASDPASSLDAQKESLLKQKEQMEQKAMGQAAKAVTLMTMLRAMPTVDSVTDTCIQRSEQINEQLAAFKQGYMAQVKERFNSAPAIDGTYENNTQNSSPNPGSAKTEQVPTTEEELKTVSDTIDHVFAKYQSDPEGICLEVVTQNNMVINTAAIDAMKGALAEAGFTLAADLMFANLLKKRANQIDDLKNKLEDYNPEDNFASTFTPSQLAKYCEEIPNDPRCKEAYVPGTSKFATPGMQIEFGDPGGATTFNQGENLDGEGDNSDSASRATPGSDIAPRIAAEADKSDSFNGAGRSPAALKAVQGGGGSAGGGGGMPGGVGIAGAGNVNPNASKSAPSSGKIKKKNLGYAGGNQTAYSRTKVYRKKKKKAAPKNPFANMFGKRKNSAFNFRSVASKQIPKRGSLFKRISKRYQIVNNNKRLLIYDTVD